MAAPVFRFLVHDELLAIARLAPAAPPPDWARGGFVSITRTSAELSIVCAQRHVPPETTHERDKLALRIEGTVPMTSIGILAGLCASLAGAGVPVFVISTYDTDWLLYSASRHEAARRALEAAGHAISGSVPER